MRLFVINYGAFLSGFQSLYPIRWTLTRESLPSSEAKGILI